LLLSVFPGLVPHAHNITLLERDPTALLHDQGAGIVAGGDTLAFFKRYDKSNRDLAVTSTRRQYLSRDGDVIHKEDMKQNMTSWGLAYHMLRANVDGIKSNYCHVPQGNGSGRQVTHLHRHKVAELHHKVDKVVVQYETSEGEVGGWTPICRWKSICMIGTW
jgi:2-polyprenyl-6-methoxyphenol hydroxylase-like FAD-dependent oxidoreductase